MKTTGVAPLALARSICLSSRSVIATEETAFSGAAVVLIANTPCGGLSGAPPARSSPEADSSAPDAILLLYNCARRSAWRERAPTSRYPRGWKRSSFERSGTGRPDHQGRHLTLTRHLVHADKLDHRTTLREFLGFIEAVGADDRVPGQRIHSEGKVVRFTA